MEKSPQDVLGKAALALPILTIEILCGFSRYW